MSFMTEFPHTDFYSSDLRELIAMYKKLLEEYNSIKAEIDTAIDTINNFDSIIDEKVKAGIENNLRSMQNQLNNIESKMQTLESDFKNFRLDVTNDINGIRENIVELNNYFDIEMVKVRLEMNELLEMFAEYKDSLSEIFNSKINELLLYINEQVTKLERLSVINPFDGTYVDIQVVLDQICRYLVYGFGLTAKEYDDMQLKASEYDNLMISASAYSMKGFFMFFEHFYLRMRSPFTGLMDTYANIINNLVRLHKKSITAEQYDGLEYTSEGYDMLGIDAYRYDWNGEVIAVMPVE